MRYVIRRVKEDLLASEVTSIIHALQANEWVAKAWEEVTAERIKNCIAKRGFDKKSCEVEDDVDDVLKELFKEFKESEITAEEYIDFDVEVRTSVSEVNSDKVDWRLTSVEKCVGEYLRKESGVEDIGEVSYDGSDKGDENADVEEKIATYEALTMCSQ